MQLASQYFLKQTFNSSIYLPSITCDCDPEILQLVHCFNDTSQTYPRTFDKVSRKMEYFSFSVQIFISAICHMQLQSHFFIASWWSDSNKASKTKSLAKSNIAFSDRNTLTGSAKLVYSVHVYYEKERWRNTPIPKINTHMK